MKTLLNILILAALATAGARADIVNVVFDNPDQTGHPGDILRFFGTITYTGTDPVFLNGDPMTLAGLSLATTDLFFSNVPVSLDGASPSRDIELFDVTVSNPLLDAPGLYQGTYNLLGGVDGDAEGILTSADFSVTTVPSETSTVPEPGSCLLLGTMLLGLITVHGLRRRKA
jgi:hypothetical protein